MRNGPASALYSGAVVHQRMRPKRHRLRYRVFSLLLDLDELPALSRRLRLLSLNRFNLFSIHLADHGAGEPQGPRAHVERQLQAAGLPTGGAIRLLTMPRILGYAFNPISVYYCYAPAADRAAAGAERLQALLYEVNNTFGQRHSYFVQVPQPQDADDGQAQDTIHQQCSKRLYVSPFLGMEMHYRFRMLPPGERLSVGVQACDGEGTVLAAALQARRRPLTDATLLAAFFTHPLLTLKVVGAIHWEALRLWLKGVRLQPRPAPPPHPVTIVSRHPAP
jgi:DUF1365 family protein